IYYVCEQNSSNSGIPHVGSGAWQNHCSCRVCFNASEKSFCDLGLYLDDLFCHHAMSFTMHTLGRLSVWCMAKTKDLACLFVEPVFAVFDAVFPLRFHIFGVSLGDILRGRPVRKIVNVHV